VSAGDFLRWLAGIDAALQEDEDAHVPCDGCTVCCRSAQFVHIAPEEAETLAHIPSELLFPAPNLPPGHVVMGYDQRGHCPMLVDDRCSIYEHRPRACRTYDCRVFAATGIEPDSPLLKERVAQWEFAYPTPRDRDAHTSLRAAAARRPTSENPTRRAIEAIVERNG
jgi:Fe-S-cluster containining protein